MNGAEAFGREVRRVVVDQLIVVDADVAAALARKVRKIEDAHAAGVVSGDVFIGVDIFSVLDLEAVDVVLDTIAAQDDVFRLADVNAGICGAAGDGVFDEKILALDRINAVGAVAFVGAAGPFDAHAANGDVAAALNGETVAGGVFNGEVLNYKVVGFDQDALRASGLAGEGENGLVHAFAAQGDAVDGERHGAIEMKLTFGQIDSVARFGVDQALLQRLLEFLCVWSRLLATGEEDQGKKRSE